MELNFSPLPGNEWIMNARIPISKCCRLSVSYNREGCEENWLWFVGEKGSYEVGIQIMDPDAWGDTGSLVSFEDNPHGNVWPECGEKQIEELVEKGKSLVYAGTIEVFDMSEQASEPEWGFKFICAEGYDLEQKLAYAERMWGEGKYRFVAAEAIK